MVLQVLLENEFAVALAVEFEVSDLVDIVLVYHAQLASHVVVLTLVNVQYVLRLPEGVTLVLWQTHEGCRLIGCLFWGRGTQMVDSEVVGVFA